MRLSRILIILVILLGGFWLVTTHLQPTHSMGRISLFGGDGGGSTSPLELTEAQAAPKYDAEEENNIAVYKECCPRWSTSPPRRWSSISSMERFRSKARARDSFSTNPATF